MNLRSCVTCHAMISPRARRCPRCGEPSPHLTTLQRFVIVVVVVLVGGGVFSAVWGGGDDPRPHGPYRRSPPALEP